MNYDKSSILKIWLNQRLYYIASEQSRFYVLFCVLSKSVTSNQFKKCRHKELLIIIIGWVNECSGDWGPMPKCPRPLSAQCNRVPRDLSAQCLSFYFLCGDDIFIFNYGEGLSYASLGKVRLWWLLFGHMGSLHRPH